MRSIIHILAAFSIVAFFAMNMAEGKKCRQQKMDRNIPNQYLGCFRIELAHSEPQMPLIFCEGISQNPEPWNRVKDKCGCEGDVKPWAPSCQLDFDQAQIRLTCKDAATVECREAVKYWGEAYRSAPNAADPTCYRGDPNYRASQEAAESC